MNDKVKELYADEMAVDDISAILSNGRPSTQIRDASKEQMHTLPFGAYNVREIFDPLNPDHVRSYKSFLENGRWEQKFFCEFPHATVPETVHIKFALAHINNFLDTHAIENRISQ